MSSGADVRLRADRHAQVAASASATATVVNLHAYKTVPIESLVPYAQNPRTHSDAQIEQLRASIREFGFTNPLLIDERGGLIAGHGRLLAARAEGMTELPAIVVAGLSDAQRRALVIADNQLALNAAWDMQLLSAELKLLAADDFDLELTGFKLDEIEELTVAFDPNALQPRLDVRVRITCPHCGHAFERP